MGECGRRTLKLGPIGCPETSVRNCRYSLRNNPEERSSPLLRGGILKSRTINRSVWRLLISKFAWIRNGIKSIKFRRLLNNVLSACEFPKIRIKLPENVDARAMSSLEYGVTQNVMVYANRLMFAGMWTHEIGVVQDTDI